MANKKSFKIKIIAWLKLIRILTPALLPIFLGDLVLLFIFLTLGGHEDEESSKNLKIAIQSSTGRISPILLIYSILEATSTWLIGKLSDVWARRKVLILVHVIALVPLSLYFFIDSIYLLLATSVLFSPGPQERLL